MSQANSPSFDKGSRDGAADAWRAEQCPPLPVIGPDIPDPAYPVMYMRGYDLTFTPNPCNCDGSCKERTQK
jgi:hypothetical protein